MMNGIGSGRYVGIVAVLLAVLLMGCSEQPQQQGEVSLRQVEVVVVESRNLVVTDSLPGRVVPVREAQVRARVAGIVMKRHFEEGTDVKQGQLLFELDAAPYKVALAKAEAELARANALFAEADRKLKRFEGLAKAEAVSAQDLDAVRATLATTRADVMAAKADVDSARLNLGYTRITAPIAGRIGKALVTEGMLVGQSEVTEVAHIQQLDPVYVDFSHSLNDELARQEGSRTGRLQDGDILETSVNGTATKGTLRFAHAAVDQATGTIALRGEFPNPHSMLLPGMYVQVLTKLQNQSSILLPQRAISRGADGSPQVFVVGEQGVEVRNVQTGKMIGTEWQILSGLNAGDKVVVGGNAMLQPGEQVEPVIKQDPTTANDA